MEGTFFYDSHFHLIQCIEDLKAVGHIGIGLDRVKGCSCALGPAEFEAMERICLENGILPSFGIHPQNPDEKLFPFLERLLKEKRIAAIGEIGFDFFDDAGRLSCGAQERVWERCLQLASLHGIPVIIHNRKALDMMFRYATDMAELPAVMFHGFSFSSRDAFSLLDKGVNAYFSFGKNVLRGAKRNVECIANLPLDRILFETDAPFQKIPGEPVSGDFGLSEIYSRAAAIRGIAGEELKKSVDENFKKFFERSPYLLSRESSSCCIASTVSL